MGAFGERLRHYRQRAGLGQRALAERIGMTPSHLNRVEHGTRNPPRIEAVLAAIKALRLSLAEGEDLLALAGYEPDILTELGGAVFSAPALAPALSLEALLTALDAFEPAVQQHIVDALAQLVARLGESLLSSQSSEGGQHD